MSFEIGFEEYCEGVRERIQKLSSSYNFKPEYLEKYLIDNSVFPVPMKINRAKDRLRTGLRSWGVSRSDVEIIVG